jgi:glyoxalase family protein
VSRTLFAVPQGALGFWRARFAVHGVRVDEALSGVRCLAFQGPDGEALGLVEVAHDTRDPHVTPEIPAATAIRGFYGARLTLRKVGPTATLLRFMGYRDAGRDGAMHRFALPHGNGADHIDLIEDADAPDAVQGAGSVHHLAFAVRDRKTQNRVRTALVQAGHRVTEVMDRSYFYAIYFRAPCGVLFEIATACPGFDADEDRADLGRALKLPEQHEHMRGWLQDRLVPLDA